MARQLRIVKFPSAVAANISLQPITVGEEPLVIGRDEKCNLILPDTNRFVSREHCRIAMDGASLTLWVLSKVNGVQVDNRDVEPGEKHILSVGEKIIIGEYELALEQQADNESTQFIPSKPVKPIFLEPEVKSVTNDFDFGLEPQISPANPFAQSVPHHTEEQLSVPSQSFVPDNPFMDLAEPVPSLDNSLGMQSVLNKDVFVPDNPFFALAEPVSSISSHAFVPDNPFADLEQTADIPQVIPEKIEPTTNADTQDVSGFNDSWVNFKVDAPKLSETSLNHVQPINEAFVVKNEPITTYSKELKSNDETLMALLIKALGVDADRIIGVDDKEFVQRVGVLLNKSIELIVTLLRLRASVKDEMGDIRTLLNPHANNPLKISPNVVVALNFLLGKTELGFMNYASAINAAAEDIINHERSLLTVPQYACQQILSQLSPSEIESEVEKQGGLGIKIQIQKDAKSWNQYKKTYAECHANLDLVIKKAFNL